MKSILQFIVSTIIITAASAGYSEAQPVHPSEKIGDGVYELVYNPKDKRIYVATTRGMSEKPTIYALNRKNLKVKDSIVLETAVFGLGIDPETQTLYGTATRAGTVVAIDIKSGKQLSIIDNGLEKGHTREVVTDRKNHKIYVSDVSAGVWAIDGRTKSFDRMLNGIAGATGLAVDPERDRLYAIHNKSVVFYDLNSDTVIDTFPTGGERPINLALDTKRNRLLISHQGSGTVSAIDAENGRLLGSVSAGEGALGITYHAASDRIYVANRGAGTVTIVNAGDYTEVNHLKTGSFPNTVVTDDKGTAYISHKAQGVGRPKKGEQPKKSDDPEGDRVVSVKR